MPVIYITDIEEVTGIHSKTVEISGGGAHGVLDLGSLEAALTHVQNDDYYPTFVDKVSHLVFVANKGHCFQDGNKRIAISLGSMFLLKNGYLNAASRFLYKMEAISYHLAAGRIDKEFLLELVDSIIYEEDYSEEIKLKFLECITGVEEEE